MHLAGGILFYIAGLATAPYLYEHNLFILFPFILAGIALTVKATRYFPFILLLFLFTFGLNQYFLTIKATTPESFIEEAFAQKYIRLEGVVNSINSRPENGLYVDLDSVHIIKRDKAQNLKGIIRIYVETSNTRLQPGETVRLQTRLRKPRNFATPGSFNYTRYLSRRNIIATGFTRQSSNFARIHTEDRWQPVFAIRKWRSLIRQQINAAVTEDAAPFVKALAIGDRGAMSTAQRKLLAESGLAHLFAISGLHLGLVATFLYLILRSIYLRTSVILPAIPPRRVLLPVILPILLGYMILTGSAISTLRALLMFVAAVVLCCCSRRSRPLDILAAAGFIILILDPLVLFEPSFQLSFAGAAGIVLFLPFWQNKLARLPAPVRYPLMLLAVTLAASLATLPLVLLHFHILAPAGPLLNLAAVPLVSFVIIPLILVATLLTLVSPVAAAALFKVTAAILIQFMVLIERIVAFGPLQAKMLYLSPPVIGSVSLLFLFALFHKNSSGQLKTGIIIGATLLLLTSGLNFSDDNELRVTAFDVGQGDSTLLQIPGGYNYLIDGGGLYSKRFDTGERLVAPALGYLGVGKLDAVILTHDHPDHRQGLVHILQHFPVAEFWCAIPRQELHYSILRALEMKNIPVRIFQAGWSSVSTSKADLQVFTSGNRLDNLNNRSLVLYAGLGADGVLLTGDLEEAGIFNLAAATHPGPVSLLKIPHHGSRNSDPSRLLDKFNPAISFISAGQNNRYGLPHPDIVNKIVQRPTTLWRTDLDGSLRFISKGQGWAITHWKKGLFR